MQLFYFKPCILITVAYFKKIFYFISCICYVYLAPYVCLVLKEVGKEYWILGD